MIPNRSPWLNQLKRTRAPQKLGTDTTADLAIVGAGIAGITTAFFALRNTDKSVILIEADQIAHGATGHNAGQLTSYFERPLHDIAEQFGEKLAAEGQRAVESAWLLLDEIIAEAKLTTPVYRFTGYGGCSTTEELLTTLKNNRCRIAGSLPAETILVTAEWAALPELAPYVSDFAVATQEDILKLLETTSTAFKACFSSQKGCTNSALLCEELVAYLAQTYGERFSVYEHSPVKTLTLEKESAFLAVGEKMVHAKRVILCTNGFENFHIINNVGKEIDTSFHHLVRGRIGYMAGYIEPLNHPPTAISYYVGSKESKKDPTGDAYFYLTRRPHEHTLPGSFNLVCAGGPEKVLPNQADYSRADLCSEEEREKIAVFLREHYRNHPGAGLEYEFCWHGLMGYTPNGIRRIGPEPLNPTLLYNLGCNGVGILPSIYGAMKISQFLEGAHLPPSIFDPEEKK